MPGEPHPLDGNAILDATDAGMLVLDTAGCVVRWNRWMEAAAGRRAAQVLGKTLAQIFAGIDLKRLPLAITEALSLNASTIITHSLNPSLLPLRTISHRPLFHDITVTPIGHPQVSGCLVFIADVTMATTRERFLRSRQDARYDAVVARSADVILTVDEAGLIQFANPAAAAQFAYQPQQLLGRAAADLFMEHDSWHAVWGAAINDTPSSQPTELAARRQDGSITYLEASASRWSTGTHTLVTVILRDNNQRRAVAAALNELNQTLEERIQQRTAQLMKAEEALRQSQKMEAIGNLTGGIAHDFNNLLHVINGNLYLLKRDVAGNERAQQCVLKALEGVKRGAKLSQQLLAFARRQPLDPKVIQLEDFFVDMEDILSKALGEGIAVDLLLEPGLWNTLVDPGNVENALLNLAINARDAMEGQGRLTIEGRNAVLSAEYALLHPEVTPGQYVHIAVSDTGTGMTAEVLQQAFDPFFTTKPEGRGTGLGLSMVYGFVKQSGGHIRIESEPGLGTTVSIYLPRSVRSADKLVDLDATPVTGGNEMILIAEDDESVRDTVAAMLNELGYRVVKAKDAQGALTIIESGMPIDLLFTDVVMPGPLQSTELARKARERMPHLTVLFTSGYPDNAVAPGGSLTEGMELLSKPYSRDALARKVRHVLAATAQRHTPV